MSYFELYDTNTYNSVLKTFDRGGSVIVTYTSDDSSYFEAMPMVKYYPNNCLRVFFQGNKCYISPSIGYNDSDLYVPKNISPAKIQLIEVE